MKIVASLTTMPGRIDLIRPTIDSISKQTVPIHHIEINVPYKCIRTDQEYIIPEWLSNYPNLQIYRTPDYGAITKVAPTFLRYINDEETYIWSVDDDHFYKDNTLSCVLSLHNPEIKQILTVRGSSFSSGFTTYTMMDRIGAKCDILEGYAGVLYPPKVIDDDFEYYLSLTDTLDCRCSDDITLSNYFHLLSVPIVISSNKGFVQKTLDITHDKYATHLQSGGHGVRYKRVIEYLKSKDILAFNIPSINKQPVLINSKGKPCKVPVRFVGQEIQQKELPPVIRRRVPIRFQN